MKHFLFSVLFTITFFSFAKAQSGNISGRITMENKEPVVGAVVIIKTLNKQTLTDDKGQYFFKNIPYGTYTLEVGSMEVHVHKMQIQVNKFENYFNVYAKSKDSKALNEVSIKGKTEKKKMETSGFAMAVIETKEAALRNLTTNELLDRTVGIRVRQNGGEGSPIEYNLNGMSGSAIGLFIDGIPMSTYGSSFNLNTIPPSMIERIEVYKGVLPPHLTGNFVGGAIDVIMKKGASANNITVAASYGSFNTYRADIGGMYRNAKNGLTFRVSGYYSHADNNYEMWGKFAKYTLPSQRLVRYNRARRPNDKFETVGGRFEIGFTDVKWADQFFIGYNVSDSYKDIPHGLTMTRAYLGRFNEYQAHVLSLNYIKNNFLTEGLRFNVNAVHSMRNVYLQDTVSQKYNWAREGSGSDELELMLSAPNANGETKPLPYQPGMGQQGRAVMSNSDRTITNMRSNLAYEVLSGHRLSLNHSFRREGRDDQDLLDPSKDKWVTKNVVTENLFSLNYEAFLLKGKLKTNIFGKYGFYKTEEQKPISETGGVINYQNSTSNRNNNSFGGTVSYEPINNGFIILSAEKTFVMPTNRHIFGEPENNILPNPDITSELSVNYNFGARYGLNLSKKHRFSFYANGFWRNGYDKIVQQTREEPVIQGRESQVEDIQVAQFVNLDRTQTLGFEGEVSYNYNNRFNAMVNFSKFNTLIKARFDGNGNPNTFYGFQVPNEPFFTINSNLEYRFKDFIQKKSNLNVFYNMGYVAPFSTIWYQIDDFMIPTQFSHDFGASYRVPKGNFIVSVDAKNVFDAEVYDNFGVQKPGRAFYIKLNYTINNFK